MNLEDRIREAIEHPDSYLGEGRRMDESGSRRQARAVVAALQEHSDYVLGMRALVNEAMRERAEAEGLMEGVLSRVALERQSQLARWTLAHDDRHFAGDWTRFIVNKLGKAEACIEADDVMGWTRRMMQVAALAVAAVEWRQRSGR